MKNSTCCNIVYIGELPPPYGGISIKNKLILNSVFSGFEYKVINLYDYSHNIYTMTKLFYELLKIRKEKKFIFIGTATKKLQLLLKFFFLIGGKSLLNKINIFVMGGIFCDWLEDKPDIVKLIKETGMTYFELHSMEDQAKRIGLTKTTYFPNCRDGKLRVESHSLSKNTIRLVFFSTVNREKGVPELLDMAEILSKRGINFTLDIYGELQVDYKSEFESKIISTPNCKYCGVYDVITGDVYHLLNSYDLLLLPTHWKGESCVGVLVESKVAGIPAIVSNWRFNSEIIIDGIEGFVVDGDLPEGFANAIERITKESGLYEKLCSGAVASIGRYDFNTYVPLVQKIIMEQLTADNK